MSRQVIVTLLLPSFGLPISYCDVTDMNVPNNANGLTAIVILVALSAVSCNGQDVGFLQPTPMRVKEPLIRGAFAVSTSARRPPIGTNLNRDLHSCLQRFTEGESRHCDSYLVLRWRT